MNYIYEVTEYKNGEKSALRMHYSSMKKAVAYAKATLKNVTAEGDGGNKHVFGVNRDGENVSKFIDRVQVF